MIQNCPLRSSGWGRGADSGAEGDLKCHSFIHSFCFPYLLGKVTRLTDGILPGYTFLHCLEAHSDQKWVGNWNSPGIPCHMSWCLVYRKSQGICATRESRGRDNNYFHARAEKPIRNLKGYLSFRLLLSQPQK